MPTRFISTRLISKPTMNKQNQNRQTRDDVDKGVNRDVGLPLRPGKQLSDQIGVRTGRQNLEVASADAQRAGQRHRSDARKIVAFAKHRERGIAEIVAKIAGEQPHQQFTKNGRLLHPLHQQPPSAAPRVMKMDAMRMGTTGRHEKARPRRIETLMRGQRRAVDRKETGQTFTELLGIEGRNARRIGAPVYCGGDGLPKQGKGRTGRMRATIRGLAGKCRA